MILDIKVGGITKRPLTTVDENTLVFSATKTMAERGIGSLGVTRDSRIVGIVTERDLVKRVLAEGRDPKVAKVREIMTQDLIAVDVETPLREALDLMNRRNIRRMLVTERGEIVGIFTQRDVMSLNRACLACGREITSALELGAAAQPYIQCECGSRYHVSCAKVAVNCADCSRTLVTHVMYPEPSDTMGG